MASREEIKGKKFCKFHLIPGHSTNNCAHFTDLIQKAIKGGRLKFEEKHASNMVVNDHPFPMNLAYVEPNLMPINVVEV